jgi:2-phospho-L-lactate guanylyltransferase
LTRIVAIPVKPFDVAKARLSTILSPSQREALSVELARMTAKAAIAADASPLILSADDAVTEWASTQGYDVLLDEGSSLNEAAHSATVFADDEPWIVCHADLPLLRADDLVRALDLMQAGAWVVAPSSDGGTSLIGGVGDFDFAFGPGSFHRHLARLASRSVRVLASVGTLLDLDTAADFRAAAAHPRGGWLQEAATIPSDV